MIGENWEDFFDLIIVQARKPMFFTDESRPLRVYDRENDTYLWDRVTELKKGTIYFEVCKQTFSAYTDCNVRSTQCKFAVTNLYTFCCY